MMTNITKEDLNEIVDRAVAKHVTTAVQSLAGSTPEPQISDGPENVLARRGSLTRGRSFTIPEKDKGIAAARFVRALAFGGGSLDKARYFVGKMYDDELGDEVEKALMAGDLTAGGALVPPEYAAEIIELLRAMTVVRAAGARTLPMPGGTLTIRRQTAGSTASYVGESQDIDVTEPTTDLLVLSAKKLAAIVPISNDLLKFTSGPSADEFIRDDLVMEISIREDLAFLRDDGTEHTPKGMRNWAAAANVTATNGTASGDIEDDFKDLINDLEGNNVRLIRPAWFMHPRSKNHLRNLRDANGNLIYPEIRSASPVIYGWPVFVTTSIPANLGAGSDETEIYFADMVDMLIGEVAGLEIVASNEASYVENATVRSAFSRDETVIRAIEQHDFAVRHDVSVAVKTAVLWGA